MNSQPHCTVETSFGAMHSSAQAFAHHQHNGCKGPEVLLCAPKDMAPFVILQSVDTESHARIEVYMSPEQARQVAARILELLK